ncbi:MAG: efflux RND transporter periplasmic adaptor subunit [Eubacteriales bacterium]|nr:efflux RND transporter periplasmic adaptor subunit [Eubacteriales bacterium]
MSVVKKIIIGVLVAALVVGGAAGGLLYMKNANQKEVLVTSVGNLTSEYYMPTSLEGQITTNVSQNVTVDKDMIIEEVFVQKGDSVKKGDTLITFDTTLVEMELKIAKLKREKQQQDLNKAINRLNSLQNGGPIEESDTSPINADNLKPTDNNEPGDDDPDMASLDGNVAGNYLAFSMQPALLAALFDSGVDEEEAQPLEEQSSSGEEEALAGENETEINEGSIAPEGPSYQDPSAGDFTSGDALTDGEGDGGFESGEDDAPKPSPTPTPALDDDTGFYDPYFRDEIPGITDGEAPFYQKLDGRTEPFTGKGTEEDPYIFLCSSAKSKITAMGSFFNKMAGYSEDGTKVEHEGGYWYQLEFHQNDTVSDFENRKESCIGYYLINGSLLEKPVYMYTETEFTLEGASQYEEEELPPDDTGNGGGGSTSTMTRAEAIKLQQTKIASLKLDIQESDIKIAKLEKKVSRQVVYSKLDGTVAYVGDPLTGTSEGNAFIQVKSKDGFYVKGTVSELMLDEMKEGTILDCMSYNAGSFTAEVIDVSDYPVSSGSNYYYGEGNPNSSYYTYSAMITDQSIQVSDQDWLTVTLNSQAAKDGSLILMKAFVRSTDGTNYVYKDDNGVLKKQVLSVGSTVDGGYYIIVKGGITKEDKIAFPYGKYAQEGVKTREGTLDEIYGY